jgi:hypothetical protein
MLSGRWRLGSLFLVVVMVWLSGDVVPRAHAVASAPLGVGHAGGRARQSSAQVNHAAWYMGTTSAGTRIDFRTSPSGERVRDFHFGSPALTCPDGTVPGATLPDGNFPLSGLRVSQQAFSGVLQAEDFSPANADSPSVRVSGSFLNQRQVTGMLHEETRGDCGFTPFTFTATRVRSLPARPTTASGFSGLTVRGSRVRFTVSRSGRRVVAFRFAAVDSYCLDRDTVFMLRMAHSYPAVGLRQNRDGVFVGVLSSRLSARGHPAGTRVRVSVLFLSPREATGTVHVIGGAKILRFPHEKPCSSQETLPFRATLTR